jgi:hypothetical protein
MTEPWNPTSLQWGLMTQKEKLQYFTFIRLESFDKLYRLKDHVKQRIEEMR